MLIAGAPLPIAANSLTGQWDTVRRSRSIPDCAGYSCNFLGAVAELGEDLGGVLAEAGRRQAHPAGRSGKHHRVRHRDALAFARMLVATEKAALVEARVGDDGRHVVDHPIRHVEPVEALAAFGGVEAA